MSLLFCKVPCFLSLGRFLLYTLPQDHPCTQEEWASPLCRGQKTRIFVNPFVYIFHIKNYMLVFIFISNASHFFRKLSAYFWMTFKSVEDTNRFSISSNLIFWLSSLPILHLLNEMCVSFRKQVLLPCRRENGLASLL